MEGVTRKSVNLIAVSLVLILVLLFIAAPLADNKPVFAGYPPSILKWSFVNTPTIDGNVIVSPSEINRLAVGPDDQAIYAVDIHTLPIPPNRPLYKSTNNGVTWDNLVTDPLVAAGASLPVWDIAVSPDDVNFVVAVTDAVGALNGPQNVFVSTDGGQNWQNTNVVTELNLNEFISCVAISVQYDIDKRYIAIATRDGTGFGNGRVFTFKAPGPSAWSNQTVPPPGDIVAMKFSPSYVTDTTIVVVFASPGGLFLNIGTHDIIGNGTAWRSGLGYPIRITASDTRSPTHLQIITADLELPIDFSGADPGLLRRYFLSYDARDGGLVYFSGVYRVDNTVVFQLMYNTSLIAAPAKRISSIAYWGTHGIGKLIASETTTATTRGVVDIWLCLDPFTTTPPPGWKLSNTMKSPTGGGHSATQYGFANAFLSWSAKGDRMYCGTSSADLSVGGTAFAVGQWPRGLLNSIQFDESAFSISLDSGETWNQLSLIDTEITLLTDVAASEAPEGSEDHSVLYLASTTNNAAAVKRFDSIWRSVSDPMGMRWERILCTLTEKNDIILRINPRIRNDNTRSTVVVFADRDTYNIRYSANEGQNWEVLYPGVTVTDFTLASDDDIYILNDIFVTKGTRGSPSWTWGARIGTGLTTGHTITTPFKNPKGKRGIFEDWVIVGSAAVGEVTWADFSQIPVKFLPSADERKRTPVQGDIHVLADEQFEANKIIYAASGLVGNGKIYRWTIGKSTEWEEIQPPNNNFYGLEQRRGALYGANVPTPPNPTRGLARTLYPRAPVPPPPEWNDLTADLPAAVRFTREPSSLKISGRVDNNLWAIDNRNFNWGANPTKEGCLWVYTDTLAKNGPWTTAPPSSGLIPVDPVTGRANEVNFAWRQLSYTRGYELQIAKDNKFTMRVAVTNNIVPPNPLAPAWIVFPGLLDASHQYFWRVRASLASTGEVIYSPWSATMYFTVMAGLPVEAKHLGPTLLQPPNKCSGCATAPGFSWSPMFQTTQYQFVLAKDAALIQLVDTATVSTTAYQYNKGKLEKGVTYYWQVQAIKPMVSEPSPIGCFTVTDKEEPLSISLFGLSDSTSLVIWIGISLYAAFAIVMIVLIMRTRYCRRHEGD